MGALPCDELPPCTVNESLAFRHAGLRHLERKPGRQRDHGAEPREIEQIAPFSLQRLDPFEITEPCLVANRSMQPVARMLMERQVRQQRNAGAAGQDPVDAGHHCHAENESAHRSQDGRIEVNDVGRGRRRIAAEELGPPDFLHTPSTARTG